MVKKATDLVVADMAALKAEGATEVMAVAAVEVTAIEVVVAEATVGEAVEVAAGGTAVVEVYSRLLISFFRVGIGYVELELVSLLFVDYILFLT